MDKKKGNVIGVMLILVFFISSFVGIILAYSSFTNRKINKLYNDFLIDRKEEQEVYDFYINNLLENEKYIKIDNFVYLLEDNTIYYSFYIENNVIKMKKGGLLNE